MGIGDWGLGIGDWPNPQSPIPNPQTCKLFLKIKKLKIILISSNQFNYIYYSTNINKKFNKKLYS